MYKLTTEQKANKQALNLFSKETAPSDKFTSSQFLPLPLPFTLKQTTVGDNTGVFSTSKTASLIFMVVQLAYPTRCSRGLLQSLPPPWLFFVEVASWQDEPGTPLASYDNENYHTVGLASWTC